MAAVVDHNDFKLVRHGLQLLPDLGQHNGQIASFVVSGDDTRNPRVDCLVDLFNVVHGLIEKSE
jgi:hypothetical protein